MASFRLRAALACLVGIALEIYVIGVMPHARAGANGVSNVAVTEFGTGGTVAQAFAMQNGGLHAVRIKMSASDPVDLDVAYRLEDRTDTTGRAQFQSVLTIAGLSGTRWQTFEFPAIESSARRDYVFELRAVNVRPRRAGSAPRVALLASRERPLRYSYLLVNGQERWGDLVFETNATEDTWLGRVPLKVLPLLPAPLRHMWVVYAVLGLYNALFIGWVVSAKAGTEPGSAARRSRRGSAVPVIALGVLLLVGVGVAVAIVRAERSGIDLIDQLSVAQLESSMKPHEAFDVVNVEIARVSRRAIFAHATSRISWRLTIPNDAWLTTAIALDPTAWRPESDGVVFRISVVDAGRSTELFFRHINPGALVADRRWIPVDLDLSSFAGRVIDLVFVTEPSLPGYPVNGSFDWALWGTPRVVTGRLWRSHGAMFVSAIRGPTDVADNLNRSGASRLRNVGVRIPNRPVRYPRPTRTVPMP